MIEEAAIALESTGLPETAPHFSIMLELLGQKRQETGSPSEVLFRRWSIVLPARFC